MKLDFAPHLRGRMLPGIFDYLGVGLVERFPGDPYAHQQPWAAWFWMHTTACMKHKYWHGVGCGLYRSWTIPLALRTHELEAGTSQQVLKAERPSADATGREKSLYRSPSVGSMGARQPADAGPLQGVLFA